MLKFVYAVYAYGIAFGVVTYVDSFLHYSYVRMANDSICGQHATMSPATFSYEMTVFNVSHVASILIFAVALLFYARYMCKKKREVRMNQESAISESLGGSKRP